MAYESALGEWVRAFIRSESEEAGWLCLNRLS